MINILIADDHKMFVDGIESILAEEEDIQVLAKCYDGAAVFDHLDNINMLLLDVNLPNMNGIEVCKKLFEVKPNIKVLALSMFNEESFVTEILNNGAQGYILKNTGRVELLKAIRTVFSGQSYFSEAVTQTIMKSLVKSNNKSSSTKLNIPKISRREKEVLQLIVKEFTTQEIADELFISLKTVESHRSSLLAKLNARNTAGLVRIALENNLLE
ncbi:MAG: response regulator transcription factor [Bacteroidota bacterium]